MKETTTILDKIVQNKRVEVERQKRQCSQEMLFRRLVKDVGDIKEGRFKDALLNSSTGIIAEFKRRSPSKGWIFEDAQIKEVVPYYSEGGAAAISVLTDIDFFGGTLDDLKEAVGITSTPILRKDFVIDEYQIIQAAFTGASAILLIASALSPGEVKRLAVIAKQLMLDVLLEIHSEEEQEHINEFVDVVGVNNRNLSTFVTDVEISFKLADKIPDEFVKISESGISSPHTVRYLMDAGYQGFLMGENFMKTSDPGKALKEFISELN